VERKELENACVLIVRFPHPSLFVFSLLRVSEYKECSVHNNTIFSLTRYRTWFRSQHNGYDYDDLVLGMNLPDISFSNFYTAFITAKGRNPINQFELWFLEYLQRQGLRKFFVIALNKWLIDAYKHDKQLEEDIERKTLLHEFSHCLYYLNPKYRMLVDEGWRALSNKNREHAVLNLFYRTNFKG
jgi:hypothetical protein